MPLSLSRNDQLEDRFLMTSQTLCLMGTRSILSLSGPESESFLNNLVTNTITGLAVGEARYAALLTPQGKFLYDMLVIKGEDGLFLDVETARAPQLMQRLMMYKLRSNVDITARPDIQIVLTRAALGAASLRLAGQDGDSIEATPILSYADPRSAVLGYRTLTQSTLPAETNTPATALLDGLDASALAWTADDYHRIRTLAGVPDGSTDMPVEKIYWLETGAERLNGVSFKKGCYIGQELTSRMKHRTDVKKSLRVFSAPEGAIFEPDTPIFTREGKKAGHIVSRTGTLYWTYMRLEYEGQAMFCNDLELEPHSFA